MLRCAEKVADSQVVAKFFDETKRKRRPFFESTGECGNRFRFVAAAYERRSLGIASHRPFESWGRFLPEHTTAVSMLDRLLHHCHVVVTDGDSYRMKQARARGGGKQKIS